MWWTKWRSAVAPRAIDLGNIKPLRFGYCQMNPKVQGLHGCTTAIIEPRHGLHGSCSYRTWCAGHGFTHSMPARCLLSGRWRIGCRPRTGARVRARPTACHGRALGAHGPPARTQASGSGATRVPLGPDGWTTRQKPSNMLSEILRRLPGSGFCNSTARAVKAGIQALFSRGYAGDTNSCPVSGSLGVTQMACSRPIPNVMSREHQIASTPGN